MEDPTIANWIVDLMVILAAGLLSGLLCKRLGVSLLVGYSVFHHHRDRFVCAVGRVGWNHLYRE